MNFQRSVRTHTVLVAILLTVLGSSYLTTTAESQQLRDPLETIYAAIFLGMSPTELSAVFQAHDVTQRFEPLHAGDFISLFWKGDDTLGEKQFPSSGLVIGVRGNRVTCVFYGFQYDTTSFVERRHKGSCSSYSEIEI